MNLLFKHSRVATTVILVLSISSCVRFDTRMEANGAFDYQEATLVTPYKTGDFSNVEARNSYDIPELTEQQKTVGFQAQAVDVRPPTQLMPIIDGVLLEKSVEGVTKISFNAFNQKDDIQVKIWSLLESFLAENNVEIVSKNASLQQLETGIFSKHITFGKYFNKNHLLKEASYKLSLEKSKEGRSVELIVDALSYKESSDGKELDFKLVGSSKHEIEIRFINELLEYAYQVKESENLESSDKQPLTIKLGFDDNHQSTWIADSEFLETWKKLPTLFTLLNFKIVEEDKNLGYFLLKYSQPSKEYWQENNLKPFELEADEYFIQLGEVTGGITSISWLDEDKKPLDDQKITEIYLSITKYIRGAVIENKKQTQAL